MFKCFVFHDGIDFLDDGCTPLGMLHCRGQVSGDWYPAGLVHANLVVVFLRHPVHVGERDFVCLQWSSSRAFVFVLADDVFKAGS